MIDVVLYLYETRNLVICDESFNVFNCQPLLMLMSIAACGCGAAGSLPPIAIHKYNRYSAPTQKQDLEFTADRIGIETKSTT